MRLKSCITGALLLAVLAGEAPARAATEEDREAARRLKDEAFQKIAEGSYAEGIELLEAANRRVPHPTFLFNIAVVYDQWAGHCEPSLRAFDRFFAACEGCDVEATARRRYERVQDKCEVRLAIQTAPPGARVTIDDATRPGRTPLEATLRPGRHTLRLERDGFEPHAEQLVLDPGRDRSVSVTLVPEAVAERERPDITASAPPAPKPGANLRTWGWVALGVGAAGLGVGTGYAITTVQAVEDEEALRSEGADPSEIREARDEANDAALIRNIGFGVGIAGVGTGILLHVLAGKKDRDARSVQIGTDGRGLLISGRF